MIFDYTLKQKSKVYSKSLQTLYLGCENCKSSHSWGPLARENYLIHFVVSGKGIYRYKKKEYTIHKDQAFLSEPYESIYYEADKKDPWTYAWIGLTGDSINEVLNIMGFMNSYVIDTNIGNEYYDYLLDYRSKHPNNILNEFEINIITNYLLSLFMKNTSSKILSQKNIYFEKALNYIQSNYMKPITITNISDYVGISRKYLYQIFKEKINASPKQYLTNYRLEKAILFMKNSNITIAEVARSVGYSDQLNFTKTFSNKYHMPPSKYLD